MDRSGEDPKLSEVKAVLQRLQAFSAEPDSTEPQGEARKPNAMTGDMTDALAKVATTLTAVGRLPVAIALTITGVVGLPGVVWLTFSPAERAPPPAAATLNEAPQDSIPRGDAATIPLALRPSDTSPSPPLALQPSEASASPLALSRSRTATEAAQALLMKGEVKAAREQLIGLVSEDAADVAWMLARSYDPNFLAAIAGADADPDIEQATRWYRAWYTAAVTQGLVPNSVSVERIIRSMR